MSHNLETRSRFNGVNLNTLHYPGSRQEHINCPNAQALARWMIGVQRDETLLSALGCLEKRASFSCDGCYVIYTRRRTGSAYIAVCSANPQPPVAKEVEDSAYSNAPGVKVDPDSAEEVVPGLRIRIPLHELQTIETSPGDLPFSSTFYSEVPPQYLQ